ncbi:MAG: peptidoglycan-binding protein [Cyanobacteria bacterium P01_A01_bin.84]
MKASKKASIFSYLGSLKPFSLFSKQKLNWLLLCSCAPLIVANGSTVSIAAPQKIAQGLPQTVIGRPTLKVGSKGQFVTELQAALKMLGFYRGEVDGVYKDQTAQAVSRFKQAAGMNPNGVVDSNTWQTLFPSSSTEEETARSNNSLSNFPQPNRVSNRTPISNVRTISTNYPSRNVPSTTNSNNRVIPTLPEPRPAIPSARPSFPEPRPTQPVKRSTPPAKPRNTSPKPSRKTRNSNRTTKPSSKRTNTTTKTKPNIQYTSQGLPILRPGMRGSEVLKLQQQLNRLGFLKGNVDGDFGPLTEEAVKKLQNRFGLESDGVVGGATWQLIKKN